MHIFRTDLRWDINQKLKSNLIKKLQSTTYVFAAAVLAFSGTAGMLVGTAVAGSSDKATVTLSPKPIDSIGIGDEVEVTAALKDTPSHHKTTISVYVGDTKVTDEQLLRKTNEQDASHELTFTGSGTASHSFYFKSDIAGTFDIKALTESTHNQQDWGPADDHLPITVNQAAAPATGEVQIAAYVCEDGTSVNWSANGPEGNVPETCAPLEGAQFGYVEETDKDPGDTGGPWERSPIAHEEATDSDGQLSFTGLATTHRYGIVALNNQDDVIFYACEDDSSSGGNPDDEYEFVFPVADGVKQCVAYFADTELPSTESPLIAPESNSLHNSPITISGVSTDNLGVDYVNIYVKKTTDSDYPDAPEKVVENDNNDSPFEWSTTWTPSEDGTYDIKAAAVDTSGNEENSAEATNVTYDTTAPAVPTNLSWLDSNDDPATNGYTNVQKGVLSWEHPDPNDVDNYVYKFWTDIPGYHDGEDNAWTTDESQYITTTSTGGSIWTDFYDHEGTYYFCVKAVDATGNTSACSETYSVIYDSTAPTVVITSPAYGGVLSGTANVLGDILDNLGFGHYNLSIYPGDADLSNGDAHVSARINNQAGWGGYPSMVNVSGNSASIERELDTTLLADGEYQIRLAARDAAGNRDTSSYNTGGDSSVHVIRVVIDNTAPTVDLSLDRFFVNQDNELNLEGTVDGTGSPVESVEFRILRWPYTGGFLATVQGWTSVTIPDDQEVVDINHELNLAGVVPSTQPFRVEVRTSDKAGNTASLTGSDALTFRIDRRAPSLTVSSPTSSTTLDTNTVAVQGMTSDFSVVPFVSGTDRVSLFVKESSESDYSDTPLVDECDLTFSGLSYDFTCDWNPSEDGTYDLLVVSTDRAGNSASQEVLAVTIDTTIDETGNGGTGGGTGSETNDGDENEVLDATDDNTEENTTQQFTTAPSSGFQERENDDQAVLSDETDENGVDENGNGQEDDEQEQAADGNDGFAWWWILALLAGISILYLVLRRRKHQDKN